MREVGAAELARRLAAGEALTLLDVREDWERDTAAIDGALHLPMAEVADGLAGLPKDRPLVVFCHHGGRSLSVTMLLERAGFDAMNLAGGIDAWSCEVDPSVPRY